MFSQQAQRRLLVAVLVILTLALSTSQPGHTRIKKAYGGIPLSFEANQGQSDSSVKFFSRGSGYGLFLTQTEALLELHSSESALLRMQFVGANTASRIEGMEELCS